MQIRRRTAPQLPLREGAPVPRTPATGSALSGAVRSPAAVAAMSLDEFARSALVLRVYSDVLKEEVLFAGDGAAIGGGESRVVYRATDLMAVLDADPDVLRRQHAARRRLASAA